MKKSAPASAMYKRGKMPELRHPSKDTDSESGSNNKVHRCGKYNNLIQESLQQNTSHEVWMHSADTLRSSWNI